MAMDLARKKMKISPQETIYEMVARDSSDVAFAYLFKPSTRPQFLLVTMFFGSVLFI